MNCCRADGCLPWCCLIRFSFFLTIVIACTVVCVVCSRSRRIATKSIENAITLMKQLGVAPDARHYVEYLTCLRKMGLHRRAVEVIEVDMLKNSIVPSISCYEQVLFACLNARDIELTSTLLDEAFKGGSRWKVWDQRRGRTLYTRVVAFVASLKRIGNAMEFMRQMMDLKFTIPVHLYIDIALHAAEVDDFAVVEQLLTELSHKRTFFPVDGKPVQVPIKLDEGIALQALNCAARTGQASLADLAWNMLETSLKCPSFQDVAGTATAKKTAGVLDVLQVDGEGAQADEGEQGRHEDDEEEGLETVDVRHAMPDSQDFQDNWEDVFAGKLLDQQPLIVSFHAYIEAQAKAGNIEKAFAAIRRLEECYPDDKEALSPAQGLCMVADELSRDASTVDQAYFVLCDFPRDDWRRLQHPWYVWSADWCKCVLMWRIWLSTFAAREMEGIWREAH
eukprot:evm.model.scf_989.7 EVM.evm.TU.scf_989.7   scf_989:43801-50552(+)